MLESAATLRPGTDRGRGRRHQGGRSMR